MRYRPKTREEQLLLEALFTAAIFGKVFPIRATGYSARIERNSDAPWQDEKLEAFLLITPDTRDEAISRLMDREVFPIFLWVHIQKVIENTEIPDRVTIWWNLPANTWMNGKSITEQWPVTPGPFLWKPEVE